MLDPVLGEHLPYTLFLLAVVVSAWYGGLGPTLVSVVLGGLTANFFFGTPRYSFAQGHPQDWVEAAVFMMVGVCFAAVMEARRRAQRRAEANQREAEAQARLLLEEIHAHQQVEEQLRQAETRNARLYEQAAQANAAKDEFLAMLSHELRTPLTPVLLMTSWLEVDPNLPADLKASMEVIRHNVDLEARLIDDLLDLTRIVRGKIELSRETVDVHHLVAHALTTCQADVAARRCSIKQELLASRPCVNADPARLQQVLWNLFKNALKFTPEGGQILIRSGNDEQGNVVIEVMDSGIGIDPANLPVIFDAFEQGEPSISRRFGGLGLGLAISKKLMDLHGGSITAASAGKGRGATFTIRLPAVDAPAPRVSSGSTPSTAAPACGASLRILVVEDHAGTAQAMARLLGKLGHVVTVSSSLAAALEVLAGQSFDLFISDLGLPDGSGYDLMRQVRQRHPLKGIALSGYGMEEDVAKSREAGFAAHLTKPVDFQRLVAAIQQVASL